MSGVSESASVGVLSGDVYVGEQLAFQNVVTCRAKFHFRELGERLQEFLGEVLAAGGTLRGMPFYSLNNVPVDEMTDIEFFLPINEESFAPTEGMRFHSYVELSPLALATVTGDLESQTERVYALLLSTLEAHGLEINAPFFHTIPMDGSPYVSVYVGYRDPTELDD